MKKLVLLMILLSISVGAVPLDSDLFSNIYKDVNESVVSLNIFYEDSEIPQPSLGTGFIITEDGYIMTNNHVIANAMKIFVSVNDRKYMGKVVYSVPQKDLAVIKIESRKKFKPVKLGNSDDIEKGDIILAIGNPFGISKTYTMAMISNIHEDLDMMKDVLHFNKMLQLDATLNPGNSGGPIFNLNGEVVGINFAIHMLGAGIAYCIPINTAKEYWEIYLNSLEEKEVEDKIKASARKK